MGLTCTRELRLQEGCENKHLPLHLVLLPGWCQEAEAKAAVTGTTEKKGVAKGVPAGFVLLLPPQEVEDHGPLREHLLTAPRNSHSPFRLTARKLWRFEGLGCECIYLNFVFSLI
jgi:hypothetical protein